MELRRRLVVGALFLAALVALVVGQAVLERTAAVQAQGAQQAPIFEVDPLWPKPLPRGMVIGGVIGVSADAQDHIWVLHRPGDIDANLRALDGKRAAFCCTQAPPVLVFDQAGNLVKSWGPHRYGGTHLDGGATSAPWDHWPQSEHGLFVDYKGNIWLGGQGNKDSRILKYSQEGTFLAQIGNYDPYGLKGPGHAGGPDSSDTKNFNKPTQSFVDPTTNEIYVADGYGNRRVIVLDADTGQFKRLWGAYGKKPDDNDPYNSKMGSVDTDYDPNKISQQFSRSVHGVVISKDRLVYVADRQNHRIQVFQTDGTFVKEGFIDRTAVGFGSAFDVALSADPQQRFLYVPDGMNQRVWILERASMKILTSFGQGGGYPGEFYAVHSIATDAKGNIYTGETLHGKRAQRFVYKGMGPISRKSTE